MDRVLDVAIIDYQMSNMFSVLSACKLKSLNALVTSDRNAILSARSAILPGVGSFKEAMTHLGMMGLIDVIHDFIATGKPFMGICLGMQLLFTESEEFGHTKGLDIIPGRVAKFQNNSKETEILKVPQIGWNKININPKHRNNWHTQPLQGVPDKSFMYFVHSYYTIPQNDDAILSTTQYGNTNYCSSVIQDNVFACQFHPEKSAAEGLKVYSNFAQSL